MRGMSVMGIMSVMGRPLDISYLLPFTSYLAHYSVRTPSIGLLRATRQLCTTTVSSTIAETRHSASGKSHQ